MAQNFTSSVQQGYEATQSLLYSSSNASVAADQARKLTSDIATTYDMTEADARTALAGMVEYEAARQGAKPDDVIQSYPKELQEAIGYTPAQLKLNQNLTALGSALSVAGFVIAAAGTIWAGVAAAPILAASIPILSRIAANPATVSTLGSQLQLVLLKLSQRVAIPAIAAFLGKSLNQNASMIVNNWNDVFHWGPEFASQAQKQLTNYTTKTGVAGYTNYGKFTDETIRDLTAAYVTAGGAGISNEIRQASFALSFASVKQAIEDLTTQANAHGITPTPADIIAAVARWIIRTRKTPAAAAGSNLAAGMPATTASGSSYQRMPVTRIYMSTTSKPQLLLGTFLTQRVTDQAVFERKRDDKIVDEYDMQNDAQVNLNAWLKSLPGRLTFSLSMAKDPTDEEGLKLTGTWIVMDMVLKTAAGKQLRIDSIPLGPIDPTIYTPTTTHLNSVQVELPKLLKSEEVAELRFPSEALRIQDGQGNVVPISFPASQPAPGTTTPATPGQAPAAAPTAPAAPTPAAASSAGQPAPTPPAAAVVAWPGAVPTNGPSYTLAMGAPYNTTLVILAGSAIASYQSYPKGYINDGGKLVDLSDVAKAPGGYKFVGNELMSSIAGVSAAPPPAAPAAPVAAVASGPLTYADLVNDNGTIWNKRTKQGYASPVELAAALGIQPHQIQWSQIPAGTRPS